MTSKEIMKVAAQSIRTLADEVNELHKAAEINSLAEEIVETMVEREMLASGEILPKLAEFKIRDQSELIVIQKALELGVNSNLAKLGELSDKKDVDGLTPEEIFVQNTVGDML